MLLTQLHDITVIDSEIVALHEQLQELYEKRASIASSKSSMTTSLVQSIDDSIDLADIDLSLQ